MQSDCHTPDRNYNKLNLELMSNKKENKNNPFLLNLLFLILLAFFWSQSFLSVIY